jgi:hypothetical protein
MNDNQPVRDIKHYEYQVVSTPRFLPELLDEFWDIHKVFHSYLDNGAHNFIVVIRRLALPYKLP